jgi:hypothetical protein
MGTKVPDKQTSDKKDLDMDEETHNKIRFINSCPTRNIYKNTKFHSLKCLCKKH